MTLKDCEPAAAATVLVETGVSGYFAVEGEDSSFDANDWHAKYASSALTVFTYGVLGVEGELELLPPATAITATRTRRPTPPKMATLRRDGRFDSMAGDGTAGIGGGGAVGAWG